jgi:DNA-3-methyladenine glycosylase I
MGTPVYDDATLFEFLILETFQAGLSWITILNKGKFQESI